MNAVLLEAPPVPTCEPVTSTRALGACPVGNRPLAEQQKAQCAQAGLQPVNSPETDRLCVRLPAASWVCAHDLEPFAHRSEAAAILRSPDGTVLAWLGTEDRPPDKAESLEASAESFAIVYGWDILRVNETLVGALGGDDIRGEVCDGVHRDGHLVLGEGSRLLPGVYIEGNAVIGRNCKIGPNCYIRGNTSIGDGCHIGQAVEIKNALLMNGVSIGHLSYCGDSIVGEDTNFGAGTITANFRHDGKNHRSMVDGTLVDTGRRKFGAIIGDDVHTGIHTSIYPGRKLWPHTWTRPGTVVRKDLREPPDPSRS